MNGLRFQGGAGLLLLLIAFGAVGGYFAIRSFGHANQQTTQRINTSGAMAQAGDALIGYAASHFAADTRPYLPCPDKTAAAPVIGVSVAPNVPNDGIEDRITIGGCSAIEGNLPWVTLGLAGLDSWTNRFRYRVEPVFSNSLTGMQLTSVGTLSANSAVGAVIASALPAILISHGPNGWGATSVAGVVNAIPPAVNISERENTDADGIFVANAEIAIGGVGGEFDDQTSWITTATLMSRMQQAGRL